MVAAWTAVDREFDRVLSSRRLSVLFQPIVHLPTAEIVGYEALVRGPEGSPLASADALLEAAYRTDRVVEFDWVARATACRAALSAGMDKGCLLFLNIEPLALDSDCPADLWPDIEKGFERLGVVLEVTERSLMREPAALLSGMSRYESLVAGVALDDVGSDAVTLSMLSLIGPAVIKLDRGVFADGATPAAMHVLDIVYGEAERTGAMILAEGIQDEPQRRLAGSLGASLGQGYLFGKPGPLAVGTCRRGPVELHPPSRPSISAPFEVLNGRLTGRAAAPVLAAFCEQVARRSAGETSASVFLALLPLGYPLGAALLDQLTGLARQGVLTMLIGAGVPNTVGSGIQVASLAADGRLTNDWAVISFGPRWATAFLARAVADCAVDGEYDFGVTYDQRAVMDAARCLLRQV